MKQAPKKMEPLDIYLKEDEVLASTLRTTGLFIAAVTLENDPLLAVEDSLISLRVLQPFRLHCSFALLARCCMGILSLTPVLQPKKDLASLRLQIQFPC